MSLLQDIFFSELNVLLYGINRMYWRMKNCFCGIKLGPKQDKHSHVDPCCRKVFSNQVFLWT